MMPPQQIREVSPQRNQEMAKRKDNDAYTTIALTLGIISVVVAPCGIIGGIIGLIGLIFAVSVNEKSTKRSWAMGLNIAGMSIGLAATVIWLGILMS